PAAPPAAMAPPAVDRPGLIKGLVATALLLVLFLTPLDRATAALIVAGLILTSRKLRSRDTLGLVDWQLLILFVGLFVVVDSFTATGLPSLLLDAATARGLDPLATGPMVALTLAGSNTIGNVPLITLWLSILPAAPTEALYRLAVFSTLAGNFLLIGSIANLIVADQAGRQGVSLGFLDHARCGVPMTLLSLGFAWGWFALIA
ncbi:anion transporter, partial [Rhodospirillum rubrum]|nr:anion transporter [Rhodospirillum rubrum]